MSEDKQCLHRQTTEGRCLEEGCGKNMLDVFCEVTAYEERTAMVETGNERPHTAYMSLHGNLCYKKSVTQKCCPSQVSARDEYTLPAERETPNALVVVWSGNEARHGSRNVTLHRLRLSAYPRDLSQRIPGQPSVSKAKEVLRTPSTH